MNRKQKNMLIRIIVSAVLMVVLHFIPVSGIPRFLLYLVPYLIIGHDILLKAFHGILNRQVFDESFLMAVATIGAIALALSTDGDYVEAVDVVLMDDDPLKIAKAIRISRKCLRIVRENIVFAIGVKLICLILGAFGIANMWFAIFADVGVMIIAVLNAIRTLFVKNI